MAKMHADEAEVDIDLVQRLVLGQFPQWADMPIERLISGGTVNAVYRLGDALTVRLPLIEGGVKDLERERRWLPELAPVLPVTIPTVVAQGEPADGYPWTWSVHRWIEGDNPVEGHLADPEALARDLGVFVRTLRKLDVEGGPRAYRGVPLTTVDSQTRAAIKELRRTDEPFDADAATAAWEESLTAPAWTSAPAGCIPTSCPATYSSPGIGSPPYSTSPPRGSAIPPAI
jgi:aminoglycoside phosphotransferase (APT) family kinase protein